MIIDDKRKFISTSSPEHCAYYEMSIAGLVMLQNVKRFKAKLVKINSKVFALFCRIFFAQGVLGVLFGWLKKKYLIEKNDSKLTHF